MAPGFGAVRFNVGSLQPGEVRNITIHFAPNFASSSQGATVTGDALGTNTNLANVLDDDEATNDGQTGAPVGGRWFVIKLGDVGPNGSNVKRLGVSAQLLGAGRPTTGSRRSARSTRTRAARGRTRRTRPATASIAAGWTKIVSSASDAFPSVNPRPVAPDLTLRYFDASTNEVATHVKFVVTSNQCTGQASYHGDQDNDPNNNCGLQRQHPRERGARRRGAGVLADPDRGRHSTTG